MNNNLTAAVSLAELGYNVFPCVPNGKDPLGLVVPNGCKDATTDLKTVRCWWAKYPAANVAVCCRNCLVLDIDVKGEINGMQQFSWLAEELGSVPETPFTIETPSGGRHLYFRIPEGVDVVGQTNVEYDNAPTGIDIRVGNQYVLTPPSETEKGEYRFLGSGRFIAPEDLPDLPKRWIADFLPKRQKKPRSRLRTPKTTADKPDLPKRCRAYVAAMPAAISGQGGHKTLLTVCRAIFHGFGLSDAAGREILDEYNERCQPVWSDRELNHKIEEIEKLPSTTERGYLEKETLQSDKKSADWIPPVRWVEERIAQEKGKDVPCVQPKQREEQSLEELPIRKPVRDSFPKRLLNVPGFVGLFAEYVNRISITPQPVLAIAAGLCLLGVLAGKSVKDPTGNRCNLQIIALANSGDGKDTARKVIKDVLSHVKSSLCIESAASFQGVLSSLRSDGALLWLWDEMGAEMKSLQNDKTPYLSGILPMLMKLYSSADTTFYPNVKANERIVPIKEPQLVLYATSVPKNVLEGMQENQLIDGFLGRVHLFEGEKPKEYPFEIKEVPPVPEELITEARAWFDESFVKRGIMNVPPATVPLTGEAIEILRELHEKAAKKRQGPDRIEAALWARVRQQAQQFALLYAVSASRTNPSIDADAMKWACDLSEYLVRRKIWLASRYVADGDFGKRQNAVFRYIEESKKGRTKQEINQKFRSWKLKDRDEILDNLQETGQVAISKKVTSKRPADVYFAIK